MPIIVEKKIKETKKIPKIKVKDLTTFLTLRSKGIPCTLAK